MKTILRRLSGNMKIGRNQLCPCGSGIKYKKCCLNKPKEDNEVYDIDDIRYMEKHNFIDPFTYHDNYIHTKKVKATKINKKLLNIYDNKEQLSTKNIIDDYLEIMNYVLNYAKNNDIHTIKKLDDANIISDFIINVIGDFEEKILCLKKDEYDLNVTNEYLDKLVSTLELDDNAYENSLRCKTLSLFKLGNYELGEKIMLDLIAENRNSIFAYVELVDDYEMIGDLKKSKYYYDLGMKRTDLEDLDALEERKDYFKKRKT